MLLYICKWMTLSVFVVTQYFLTPVIASQGATFTVENKCQYTVWPGILNDGSSQISTTGFELQKGEARTITAPPWWAGRFWGRTLCAVNSTTRNFTCVTGDCGSGKVECSGGRPAPPTTILEFSLDGFNGTDFFDVNVIQGYNLPMLAVPQGDAGASCSTAGCVMDLNGFCPAELQVSNGGGKVVACKGPRLALRQDRFSSTGAYVTPSSCTPTLYSRVFKDACPRAYSYAFDDVTTSFTCDGGADYIITFCPSPNTRCILAYLIYEFYFWIVLDSDGHLRVYQWVEGVEGVADDILTGSLGDCAYPLSCGNYGICSNGQCTCPVGNDGDPNYFRQLDFRQPSLGCVEVTQMSCQSPDRHLLLELDDVTYFEFVPVLADTDVQNCKEACLKNCSCRAAVYRHNSSMSSGECSMPSKIYSMLNIQNQAVSYNSSTFIKVQKLPESPPTSSRTKANQILLIVGPILAATMVFAFFIFLYVRFKRNVLEDGLEEDGEWENSLVLLPNLPKRFSYEDLKSATQNFDVNKRLGGGGFGSVFEGTLLDGTRGAVKRLDRLGQGRKEFLAEVQTMGNIHHINFVKLLGFCAERLYRLLVYEYMSNGSLDKWIFHRTSEDALEWGIKKKIILNVAKGLTYLHEECKSRITHLDIKPQNILLDENFNAKLSDFGVAKLMERDQSQVMTHMRGTRGYLAPEWLSRKLTEKVDVYSFGVVMLEVVCGRRNLDYSASEEAESLLDILKEKAQTNELVDLVDKCNVHMQRHGEEVVELIRTYQNCHLVFVLGSS
ncbi:hypothetical protein RJ640_007631 [Escallonia rubra]|uniref:non-specific serine/threonine protein kinase n=1 Tax=Escallonia rubra TaxID=112253 RepID=A0AA88RNU9_9ASTE|nr:hypothetical protein RJ640_007631 [Escallonia rubra]